MEFNTFLWSNYKESKSGQELIKFYTFYENNIIKQKNIEFYANMRRTIAYKGTYEIDYESYITDINSVYKNIIVALKKDGISKNLNSFNDAEKIYTRISKFVYADDNGEKTDEIVFSSDDVPFLSEILYLISPTYYFPYYFERLYHEVIEIFNEFGIFLPNVPKKNDSQGRFFHYLEICKSLYSFRIEHELDEYELPAFIYGFALNIIKRYKISDILPEPRKAYFVGGGKRDSSVDSRGDFDYLDQSNESSISNWNGDPETQTGDIIVMYCLSPRSYIHSIWRAVTPGSYDPFFHFYKNVYIGKSILVEQISIIEIKNDPVLSEMPLVRGNMQGINGRNISKIYYDRIIELLHQKGQDISILPKLTDNEITVSGLNNEKDVEEKLLEPLLLKIGYNEDDWLRQMKLRMGRGDRVYPDYVIFPKEERNNESGYWIWEAKYSIKGHKQLEEDLGQAKSYALRLKSSGLGLVSKEGVWLSLPDYNINKIKFWSWKQVGQRDCLNEIFDVAGNKKKIIKNT